MDFRLFDEMRCEFPFTRIFPRFILSFVFILAMSGQFLISDFRDFLHLWWLIYKFKEYRHFPLDNKNHTPFTVDGHP